MLIFSNKFKIFIQIYILSSNLYVHHRLKKKKKKASVIHYSPMSSCLSLHKRHRSHFRLTFSHFSLCHLLPFSPISRTLHPLSYWYSRSRSPFVAAAPLLINSYLFIPVSLQSLFTVLLILFLPPSRPPSSVYSTRLSLTPPSLLFLPYSFLNYTICCTSLFFTRFFISIPLPLPINYRFVIRLFRSSISISVWCLYSTWERSRELTQSKPC